MPGSGTSDGNGQYLGMARLGRFKREDAQRAEASLASMSAWCMAERRLGVTRQAWPL